MVERSDLMVDSHHLTASDNRVPLEEPAAIEHDGWARWPRYVQNHCPGG